MSPAARAKVQVMTPDEVGAQAALRRQWSSFPHSIEKAPVRWSPYARARARQLGWGALRRGPRDARPAGSIFGPPRASLKIAMIRIDFLSDRGGNQSTGNGKFDVSGPDTTAPPIDRPPHNHTFFQKHLEALGRYYDFASYGRVHVTGDGWPKEENEAYHVSDMADLGPWKFSRDVYPQAVAMFRMFAMAADSQSMNVHHDRIPWDSYDGIEFIHAGSDLQSDIKQDSPEDIPTFHMTVADTDVVVLPVNPADTSDHPHPLGHAVFLPETETQDGYYATLNGTIAHESGHHLFEFDDVYNIETGFPVVGFWSLMDSGNLVGAKVLLKDGTILFASGLLAPSIDPFQRVMCTDTLAFREVTDGDTLALQDSEHHPDMRQMPLTGDEYLVLENRFVPPDSTVELDQDSVTGVVMGPKQPDPLEYDALLPGGGTLVWHIDESHIWFSEFPVRIPDDYGVNTVPEQLGISVIEADALADLGDPGSPFPLGSYRDPWYVSNNATLSDTTHP